MDMRVGAIPTQYPELEEYNANLFKVTTWKKGDVQGQYTLYQLLKTWETCRVHVVGLVLVCIINRIVVKYFFMSICTEIMYWSTSTSTLA